MAGTLLKFGKHYGRTFQWLKDNDESYRCWVLSLPVRGVSGQMRELQAFLRRPPATSASESSVPSSPSSSSGEEGARVNAYGLQLNAEFCGKETLRLSACNNDFLPGDVLTAMHNVQGLKPGVGKREWLFPRAEQGSVLAQVRSVLRGCIVHEPPAWVSAAMDDWVVDAEAIEGAKAKLDAFMAALPKELQFMPFQKEGIIFGLARGGRCLLGDEMGLGKTLQALAIAAQYYEEWPAIIIVPSALRLVWREQALAWLPHLLAAEDVQVVDSGKKTVDARARIVIVGYDLLQRHAAYQLRADGKEYKVAIVDEAHYIKSAAAKRTQAVLSVVEKADRSIMISGTPAVNRAEDMFTQLQAMLPKHVCNRNHFCSRYCENVKRRSGAKNELELNTLLTSTVMIRRLKKDVLTQLPAKRRQRILLVGSKLNTEIMQELRSRLIDYGGSDDEGEGAPPPSKTLECFRLTAEAKVGGVADYVEYLLSTNLKFLIFAHHHVLLDGVEAKVRDVGAKYIRIDGQTPPQKRQQAVEQFQTDEETRVAVLSITACGQGLTLTAAHTVVFAELYWVPGLMIQAEDRVHRIGQESKVDVHYCIAEGSLDNRIFKSLNRKSKHTTAILDGLAKHLDAYDKKKAEEAKRNEKAIPPCKAMTKPPTTSTNVHKRKRAGEDEAPVLPLTQPPAESPKKRRGQCAASPASKKRPKASPKKKG